MILGVIVGPSYGRQSFMESLEEGDRTALLQLGHGRAWQRGEALFYAGDRADSAIVLTAGLLKIHKANVHGAEVVLALLGPGDLLGEFSAVGDGLRSAAATALDSVRGLAIPVPDMRAWLSAHPGAAIALLALTLGRLSVADEQRLEFATSESLARVTSRLAELTERFGEPRSDGAIEVPLPINQDELASWSASSRESTARALRTLRELGLIETQRRRLTVLDMDGLRLHRARS